MQIFDMHNTTVAHTVGSWNIHVYSACMGTGLIWHVYRTYVDRVLAERAGRFVVALNLLPIEVGKGARSSDSREYSETSTQDLCHNMYN